MTQFKGQLTGFPPEIVEKMLYYQVEQGNKRDVEVFEKDIGSRLYSGGFDWEATVEGDGFWYDVIIFRDFDLFLEKCPKEIGLNKIESVPVIFDEMETNRPEPAFAKRDMVEFAAHVKQHVGLGYIESCLDDWIQIRTK